MRDRHFHEDLGIHVNDFVLQGSNHFETRAVADMCQSRVCMAAEIALVDQSIRRAIEHRAPVFKFLNSVRRFLGVQFGHP